MESLGQLSKKYTEAFAKKHGAEYCVFKYLRDVKSTLDAFLTKEKAEVVMLMMICRIRAELEMSCNDAEFLCISCLGERPNGERYTKKEVVLQK